MIVEHLGKTPDIHPTAYVAPNAAVCGDVTVGENSRILFGASVVAEGGSMRIGSNCIIMENAVVRSTSRFSLGMGNNCLIGPQAHVVGCTLEELVFIATGASIFHGAVLEKGVEVRVNGVVHLKSRLAEDQMVPIGWIAVGDPAEILPPNAHDRIWAIQKPLNFPKSVYGVDRDPEGKTVLPAITELLSRVYKSHMDDTVIDVM
jgi:carbonic anhydrase/acetyltransferase-like protein (isoleucine patch superfamily)